MSDIIKIAIADDEVLFRQGISFILNKEVNFDIVMQAKDGADLLTQLEASEELPEIILMDLKMPNLNGVETTKIVKNKYSEIKIIAITSYYSKPFISNMIATGAVAYLAKNTPPKEVVETVNAVATKGFCYNENVMQVIQENMLTPDAKVSKSYFDLNYLTKREAEVLKLICAQCTTNDIAEQLFISPRTVEGHRNNLLLKTEAKNVAGLVIYAIKNKLICLEDPASF